MTICTRCHTERPYDQYEKYWHSTFQKFYTRKICTPCQRERSKIYKQKIREKQKLVPKPLDPYQEYMKNREMFLEERKSDLYHFMVAIGWTYSIEKNIFYKDSFKDIDGNFHLPERKYLLTDIIKPKKTPELIDKIVNLRKKGWSYLKIGEEIGITERIAYNWANKKNNIKLQ